jgi:pathogenesis-related protein 1
VALLLVVGSRSSPTITSSAVIHEIIAAHNQVRATVGVPPLRWSRTLAAVAQQWADQLVATVRFAHRPNGRYGENLFVIQGASVRPAQVVAAWADEERDYDPVSGGCRVGEMCGHYTQLVSRKTKRVGCGVAQLSNREVWVCNYDPPGNVVGERPY